MVSKNFKPEEIIGYLEIDGRKVVYLKTGVHRKRYNDWVNPDYIMQMDQALINLERWTEYYKKVVGIDDFEGSDGTVFGSSFVGK